jgi:hypothetical protein
MALRLWGHGDDFNVGSGKPGTGLEAKPLIAEGAEKNGFARGKLLSLTEILYTYRFWKSFDWSRL